MLKISDILELRPKILVIYWIYPYISAIYYIMPTLVQDRDAVTTDHIRK